MPGSLGAAVGPLSAIGSGYTMAVSNYASNGVFQIDFSGVSIFDGAVGIPLRVTRFSLSEQSLTGSVVPEPAAWALMIGGFGLAGGALRRRRLTGRRKADCAVDQIEPGHAPRRVGGLRKGRRQHAEQKRSGQQRPCQR